MQHEDITTWSDRIESIIPDTIFNRVMILEETLSTQDTAARACIGLPKDHPATIVIASSQLMGRGQRANNWYDAPSCTLPCSIAIGPKLLNLDNPNLAARAGLAALHAIKAAAPDHAISIKWPNDIMVSPPDAPPKKIAGVLIEHARDSIVIGIGINCTQIQADYHPDIKDTAVSLKQLGSATTRIDLAQSLIESLNHWLSEATQDQVQQSWIDHDALIGTTQKFVYNNQPYTGIVQSIDPLKEICIATAESMHTLPVEQTRLIHQS